VKNRPFRERIGFALAGWRAAFARESSFRTQLGMAGLALGALAVLRPAPVWWGLVGLTCGMVLALELINSAVETVIDLLHPGVHPAVKAAKDMLAGAVLVMSVAALIVGVAMVVENLPAFLGEIGLW
jgi:diacylglycerol kinase (ATP)